jgi:hypothetical protein
MSSSSLFDLPLDLDARGRLSELVADGCTLQSRTRRETVEERDPCETPTMCWGGCHACGAAPRIVERERTWITASKSDVVVWEMWV